MTNKSEAQKVEGTEERNIPKVLDDLALQKKEVEEDEDKEAIQRDERMMIEDYLAETELVRGYRIFKLTETDLDTYHINYPTQEIEEEAATVKAKRYTELLRQTGDEAIPTRRELRVLMEQRGIWTEEDEQELEKLTKKIDKVRVNLEKIRYGKRPNLPAQKRQEDKLKELTRKAMKLTLERSAMDEHSIEGMSELRGTQLKVVRCVHVRERDKEDNEIVEKEDDNGKKIYKTHLVWNSVEELLADKRRGLIDKLLTEAYGFWAGGDPNFYESLQGLLAGEPGGE